MGSFFGNQIDVASHPSGHIAQICSTRHINPAMYIGVVPLRHVISKYITSFTDFQIHFDVIESAMRDMCIESGRMPVRIAYQHILEAHPSRSEYGFLPIAFILRIQSLDSESHMLGHNLPFYGQIAKIAEEPHVARSMSLQLMTELRQERSDEGHIGMLGIESQIQTGVGIEWADIPPSRRTRTIGIVYRCIQKDPLRRFLPGAESRYGAHVYTVDSEALACNACLHELPVCDVAQDSLSRHFHIEHVEVHSGQIQYVLQTDVIHTHTKRVGGRTAEYSLRFNSLAFTLDREVADHHPFRSQHSLGRGYLPLIPPDACRRAIETNMSIQR